MKAFRFLAIAVFLFFTFTSPSASQQPQVKSIDAWSKMPADSTITFFGFGGPIGFADDWWSFLVTNDIAFGTWDGSGYSGPPWPRPVFAHGSWGAGGMEYLWSGSNPGSTVAPYGFKLMLNAYRFDFADPVYAVGGTFFSSQVANAQVGVSTVYAYDESGTLLGSSKSSSLTETNGPYESRLAVNGMPLVISWAGVWSDTPIKAVEFTGQYIGDPSRVCCVPFNLTAFASFAFSRTPLNPDTDGDGVSDDADQCPGSDLTQTVIIDGCDSGVPNNLFGTGCTMSDLIAQAASSATNHGHFVSAVASFTNELINSGAISESQKDAIQSCAARARIP